MRSSDLAATARAMLVPGKGLLAIDESTRTCNKRFAALEIPQTEERRRAYRELLVTAPGLGESISGAILYDETIRQELSTGESFVDALTHAGIIPGIKVDKGARPLCAFPGEKVTEGLDGLVGRINEYAGMGARFAKWRAVIIIRAGIPTRACIDANAYTLARYAAICQEAGLVPIVEPEVLMEGTHDLSVCAEVTELVLAEVFVHLRAQRVLLEGMILKPNMVLSGAGEDGSDDPCQNTVEQVADATIACLLRAVPAAVPGVAFLSGGQPAKLASARLNAMNARSASSVPWVLTFSFGRAIQQPALELWAREDASVPAVHQALVHRARCNSAARLGLYDAQLDRPMVVAGAC